MIPAKENRSLISSGSEESIGFGISAKDSNHIMGILRDQLYSDKILAVLREIGANAQDANIAAGKRGIPFHVTLPTFADSTLRIRDCGPGLSLDDVRTVFSQYGASTKRDSNEAIGMLGIGSKSPFAYSDSFVVTSWHAGSKSIYNAVIDESGGGRIDLLDVCDCDPTETGVEVQVAVRGPDRPAFQMKAQQLYAHFDPRPIINCELPSFGARQEVPNGFVLEDGVRGLWTAVMGGIPYEVSLKQLFEGTGGGDLNRSISKVSGVLQFEIGDLQVAASRESLKYSDGTRALLITRLNAALEDYVKVLLAGFDALPSWERRLRALAISDKGLPLPISIRKLCERSVEFWPNPIGTNPVSPRSYVIPGMSFGIQLVNYKTKLETIKSLMVYRHTRLIIKDDHRALTGYDLLVRSTDVMVVPAGDLKTSTAKIALKTELDSLLKRVMLDGIPIVWLSDLPWSKPASDKIPRARDSQRAKARCFIFDASLVGSLRLPNDPPSSRWAPVERIPSKDDVFMVLDSYRPIDIDVYEEVLAGDQKILHAVNLGLPEIIGYKSTKAKPVGINDCLGTNYKHWRKGAMLDLLLTNKSVESLVHAMSYCPNDYNIPDWFSEFSGQKPEQWIIDELGGNHILSQYATNVCSSRIALHKANLNTKSVAVFVRKNRPKTGQGDMDRAAIMARYPLIKLGMTSCLSGSDRQLWVDYIRLIDSSQKQDPSEQEAT